MSEPVRFDPIQKCYFRGTKKLFGLLDQLQRRFWPKYVFTSAIYNRPPMAETEYRMRQRRKRETREQRRQRGATVGVKLDKEIIETVEALRENPTLDCAVFFNTAVRERTTMPTHVRQLAIRLMKQTKHFWHFCREKELTPYGAQVCVSHGSTGHAFDVLCNDKQGDTWIVEVKTGFDNYLTACTKHRMIEPLQNQTDCYANQHQVQLAAQRELFMINFPGVKLGGCFILHFPENCLPKMYPLKAWAMQIPSYMALIGEVTPSLAPAAAAAAGEKRKRVETEEEEEESLNKRQK
jgi:hypothetical protein